MGLPCGKFGSHPSAHWPPFVPSPPVLFPRCTAALRSAPFSRRLVCPRGLPWPSSCCTRPARRAGPSGACTSTRCLAHRPASCNGGRGAEEFLVAPKTLKPYTLNPLQGISSLAPCALSFIRLTFLHLSSILFFALPPTYTTSSWRLIHMPFSVCASLPSFRCSLHAYPPFLPSPSLSLLAPPPLPPPLPTSPAGLWRRLTSCSKAHLSPSRPLRHWRTCPPRKKRREVF